MKNLFRARLCLVLSTCIAFSGCAGGGGGTLTPMTGGGGGGSGSTGTSGGGGSSGSGGSGGATFTTATGIDTEVHGPVGVPNAPSFADGLPVTAHQMATGGGPTFDGSSGVYPSSNTSFPLLASVMAFIQGPGAQPVGTAGFDTFSILSSSSTRTNWSLIISNGMTSNGANGTIPGDLTQLNSASSPTLTIQALSYVAFGAWANPAPSATQTGGGSASAFVFGYETPAAGMPNVGQATFTGSSQAKVFLPISGATIQYVNVTGNATFSVNFASGNIAGSFTGMQYTPTAPSSALPWNDVSVSGAIASGTNMFKGTTSVTSSPANSFSLKPSATGNLTGAFYGPTGNNLGAVWTLSDGNASAIGAVVAH